MLLPTSAEDVYERLWRPMQDSLTPTQLETLVLVDLVLRGKTTIKRQDIYREQQNHLRPLEGNEGAVKEEVQELARRARFFRRLLRRTADRMQRKDPCGRRAIIGWEASTTYPLLMHVNDLWDKEACSADDVLNTLAYVKVSW